MVGLDSLEDVVRFIRRRFFETGTDLFAEATAYLAGFEQTFVEQLRASEMAEAAARRAQIDSFLAAL